MTKLNQRKRNAILKDIESKKIVDSVNVSDKIIKQFKLLETSEEKIDFLESNRKLLTQIDVNKYIENLKSKKDIFKDIKKNNVQIIKSDVTINDMKNNVKMIESVDTSKFLENNKITKCKFSIDDAVKFQRQTIKPRNKFYQKSTSMMSRYENFYRVSAVDRHIRKFRKVEIDSNN